MKSLALLSLSLASACVVAVSQTRMMAAPSRAPDCGLQLVQADMMELSPMGTKWDVLGMVTVGANRASDPNDPKIRALIRPKACELGGTAVALMQSTNAQSLMGTGSGIVFAVLRPKSDRSATTQF
jgi:hypothetical protein